MKSTFIKKMAGGLSLLLVLALLSPAISVVSAAGSLEIRNVKFTSTGVTADVYGIGFETLSQIYLVAYPLNSETELGSDNVPTTVTDSVYSAHFDLPLNWKADVLSTYGEPKSILLWAHNDDETVQEYLSVPIVTQVGFDPNAYSVDVSSTVTASVYGVSFDASQFSITPNANLTSSVPSVATVNPSTGVINGLSAGTTVITATYGGYSASATVTVNAVSSPPPSDPPPSTGKTTTTDSKSPIDVLKPDSNGKIDSTKLLDAWSKHDTVTIQLDGDRLELQLGILVTDHDIKNKNLIIITPDGKCLIKGSDLYYAGYSFSTYTLTITHKSESDASGLDSYAAIHYHASLIVKDPYTGTETRNIPVSAVYQVALPAGKNANKDSTTAVRIDPATKKPVFAPALITEVDGQLVSSIRMTAPGDYFLVRHEAAPFKDTQNNAAKDDIQLLANKFILTGRPDGSFDPDSELTRNELVQLLVNAFGLSATGKSGQETESSFTDVANTDWAAGAVNVAKKTGLISGYPDGTFRGNEKVNQEDLALLLARTMQYVEEGKVGSGPPSSSDSKTIQPISKKKAVEDLTRDGILPPSSDLSNEEVVRGVAATILRNLLQKLQYFN